MTALLLDVGNTNIHYCITAGSFLRNASPSIKHTKLNQLSELFDSLLVEASPIDSVVLANVNNRHCDEIVMALCDKHGVTLRQVQTEPKAFGLTNSYQTTSNMGVDRWLAMIACQNMILSSKRAQSFLVVDLGTAITTDFVVDGQHLGGWIAPGYQTLKLGLLKNTTKVFADNSNKDYQSWFGTDTPDCVELGLRSQIQGGFELAVRELSKRSNKFKIFITGGDRELINLKNFPLSEIHENLVLSGLSLYID